MARKIVCTVARSAHVGVTDGVTRASHPIRAAREVLEPGMMKLNNILQNNWLLIAAASAIAFAAQPAGAQTTDSKPADSSAVTPAPAKPADDSASNDRAKAYYHLALANSYEEDANTYGSKEFADRAIDEYKIALSADPDSPCSMMGLPICTSAFPAGCTTPKSPPRPC